VEGNGGDESREFGRHIRQREEQEKQEEELFTLARFTEKIALLPA
jgi:U3 small nucleolar ribonucleoprotein protein LCP5